VLLVLVLINQRNDNIYDNGYFDANGTTWIHPKALKAYNNAALLGNASAGYAAQAREIVHNAQRCVMERTWTSPDTHQIVFNSGASEGNNLIIRSMGINPHIIMSAIEHKTSLDCAKKLAKLGLIELSLVMPGIDSRIDPIDVAKEIKPNTRLISIMHINNETGAINDLQQIGAVCKKSGVYFHSDVVQSFGKMEIPMTKWNLDAITMSFHKLYGPQGVGCMVVSNAIASDIFNNGMGISGSQWNGLRGGTVNTPGIAASLAAMTETFRDRRQKNERMQKFKDTFVYEMTRAFPTVPFESYTGKPDTYGFVSETTNSIKSLNNVGFVILGPTRWGRVDHQHAAANVLLFGLPLLNPHTQEERICNIKIKKFMADHGVQISIGSACNTSSDEPSHVLKAINAPFIIRSSVCRISMHDRTTLADVRRLVDLFKKAILDQIM